MDISRMREIVNDLDEDSTAHELPQREIVDALVSDSAEKQELAARLFRLQAITGDTFRQHTPQIQEVFVNLTPIAQKDLLMAFKQFGESDVAIFHPLIKTIVSALDSHDPTVRAQAGDVLLVFVRRSDEPKQLHPYVDQLATAVDDKNRQVVGDILAIFSRLLGHGDDSATQRAPDHIKTQLIQSGIVAKAADSLEAASGNLRISSIDYLVRASSEAPEAVAQYTDRISTGLTDPYAHVRSQTGCVFSNLAEYDPESIQPALSELTPLLDDPEELARLNGTSAFLLFGQTSPTALPTAEIGGRLLPLLQTNLISVQEQAIRLALLIARNDPAAISQQRGVISAIEQLRDDDAVSVEGRLFKELLDRLNSHSEAQLADTQDSSTVSTGSNQRISSQEEATDNRNTSQNNNTGVFSGVNRSVCSSCGHSIEQSEATFCPECGAKLSSGN